MTFRIGTNSVGFEHISVAGNAVTGVLPPAPTPPATLYTYDPIRATASAAPLDAAGLGLFDPHAFVSHKNIYCTHVYISCDAGLAWTVSITSGLGDGTETTNVDNPNRDASLATGSGSAFARINAELLPKQKIRITVAGSAVLDTRILVYFTLASGSAGRLIS